MVSKIAFMRGPLQANRLLMHSVLRNIFKVKRNTRKHNPKGMHGDVMEFSGQYVIIRNT